MPRSPKHPVQPLVRDEENTLRFKKNAIVIYLLRICELHKVADLNTIAMLDFPREDYVQFAQLIGYSLNGFSELSYVTKKDLKAANQQQQ